MTVGEGEGEWEGEGGPCVNIDELFLSKQR